MKPLTDEEFLASVWEVNAVHRLFNVSRRYILVVTSNNRGPLKIVPRASYSSPRRFTRESVMDVFAAGLKNYGDDPENLARQILFGEQHWIRAKEADLLCGLRKAHTRHLPAISDTPITHFSMSGEGNISLLRHHATNWFTTRLREAPEYADADAAKLAEQLLSGEDAWLEPGEAAKLTGMTVRTLRRHIRHVRFLPDSTSHPRYLQSDVLKWLSAK